MDRAPEAVAGMGVVVPELRRARRGGSADEDETEVGAELIGEAVGSRHESSVVDFRPHERHRHAGPLSIPDIASLILAAHCLDLYSGS